MPQSLAYHFVEIESFIVLQWAWEKDSPLVNAIKQAKSQSQIIFNEAVKNHQIRTRKDFTGRDDDDDDDDEALKNSQNRVVGVPEL